MPLPGVISIRDGELSEFKDLSADLALLRAQFGEFYADLLKHEWRGLPGKRGTHGIRVVQFNQLADALCTAYSADTSDKTFLEVDKSSLRWTYRSLRMAEMLFQQIDGDLVFMEECDRYDDFWRPWFDAFGYESMYLPKDKSPTRHCLSALKKEFPELVTDGFTCPPDGVVVAWRRSHFSIVSEDLTQRVTDQQNDTLSLALAVKLKHQQSGLEFWAVASHFKSDKDRKGEALRVSQAKSLFGKDEPLLELGDDDPVIFGCDLNANPVINRHGYAPRCYEWLTAADGGGLTSAYKQGLGAEPELTTAKKRVDGVDRHTIDYIFYRSLPSSQKVSSVLQVPLLPSGKLIPDWYYPSDHFAIGVEITFNDPSKDDSDEKSATDAITLDFGTTDYEKGDVWPPTPGDTRPKVQYKLGSDLLQLAEAFGPLKETLPQKWCLVSDFDFAGTKKSHAFSMMQWNTLSDALSTGYTVKTVTKKDFIGVDKAMLRWSYRGLRIMERILEVAADVITIEECDYFDYLQKYLNKFGYDCYYVPKDRSPTRHVAKSVAEERGIDVSEVPVNPDGVCIALRRSAFKVLRVEKITQKSTKTSVFALFVKVKHVDSNAEFVIGATHLKSDKDKEGEVLRQTQIRELIGDEFAARFGAETPLFLGCDMNSAPTMGEKDYGPLCFTTATEEMGLEPAYVDAPVYTTLKKREHGVDKHTIDYIFTKNATAIKASLTHLLSIPGLDESTKFTTELESAKDLLIPDWDYPSDHFAIGAVYNIGGK
jgi:mRNA deadenylase 3'-5' endonuclease subunit Ccr4